MRIKKNINTHIKRKADILNKKNLIHFLNKKNKKSEILIIQSDDFTENGDLICENEKGESEILLLSDLFNIFKSTELKYKILILCF